MEKVVITAPAAVDKMDVKVAAAGSMTDCLPEPDYKKYLGKKRKLSRSPNKKQRPQEPEEEEVEIEAEGGGDVSAYANPEKLLPAGEVPQAPPVFDEKLFDERQEAFDDAPPAGPEYEEEEPDEEAYMLAKAQIISKLERKIRLNKLQIEIPSDASLQSYQLMYHKISYDQKSRIAVDMIKKLYIGINAFVENACKAYPQIGLELENWGEQCKAVVKSGELEELFYDVYDENQEWFEMNALCKLGFITMGNILLYSQTQRLFRELVAQVQRKEETSGTTPAPPPPEQFDLERPKLSEARLDELRNKAKKETKTESKGTLDLTKTA